MKGEESTIKEASGKLSDNVVAVLYLFNSFADFYFPLFS